MLAVHRQISVIHSPSIVLRYAMPQPPGAPDGGVPNHAVNAMRETQPGTSHKLKDIIGMTFKDVQLFVLRR
ncbi:MAG: hypothetical protein C7B45_07375 [Sulfobacillus acidophilus]|uniref:Uncharacterized protein n=1 Tax=Sulfobacillus acidophilus TaxID=53633 RepID=A0A2T2WJA0_9FIRM|nr:MAG: hypothetical protein C7B45_07375 [Sulfobacillus acidophilus]